MLKKILVTITASDSNQNVFDQALVLAKAMGAHLGILHVADANETTEDLPTYLKLLDPYMSEEETDSCCYVGHFEVVAPDLFGALVGHLPRM